MSWLDLTNTHFSIAEITLRLVLACLLGAAVGLERELRDRPAGLRTHMLVALASALFTIVAFEIFFSLRHLDQVANIDPIRLVEAVTAGVAFLAAGTIIRGGGTVRGLTTGAGMWLAGALGMTSGAGFYVIAVIGMILTFVIMVLIRFLEKRYIEPDDHGESQ